MGRRENSLHAQKRSLQKYIPKKLTCGVLKDLDGSVVDLSNGLHLNVVAIATVKPLPVDVVLKILISHILREVVHVLKLEEGGGGEERERDGKGPPH